MFWRKTRAAIEGFHPVHRDLTLQRTATAALPPAGWNEVVAGFARHAETVRRRRWRLPDRTANVLVPLIRVLCEDVAPDGVLALALDLRGPDAPGKAGPQQDLPVRRPVRKMTQWFAIDPWLRARAELRDGSVLELTVTDRVRYRRIHKVNPRGKRKTKTKTKTAQRIGARRTIAAGRPVRRPGTPPPPWIRVRTKHGKRVVLDASAKLSPAPTEADQIQWVLSVVTEVFRWTPEDTVRRIA